MENQLFLLTELEDLSTIFAPLKTRSRIKYTCFNVSNNFLIFGATSGSLYVFQREPCCFLQLLPNKEGSVTHLSISPDEKLIAFSTVKGIVCVLEKLSHGAKNLISTTEHQNEQVTCLQWNDSSNELFVGDNTGKVSILTISIFSSKSMFQTPSFVLMQLDSKIVQMDFNSNMLLVSTLTKCYICDTTKEIFRQVGHKLREGEYGACIFNTNTDHNDILNLKIKNEKTPTEYSNLNHLRLLCARPGSRIWEVAIDGTVISTHHFKEALAVPPRKIFFLNKLSSQNSELNNSTITNGSSSNEQINFNYVEQSFNFQKLYVVLSKFCLTFKNDGIYIFDPQKAAVVLWNNEISNIVDIKCINDAIYVWSGFGKMHVFNLVLLEKFLIHLYFRQKYLELAKLCLEFKSSLISLASNSTKLYILNDLDEKLKCDGDSIKLCDSLEPFLKICKEHAQQRKVRNAQKLKSGIYVISNNDHTFLDDEQVLNKKFLRPNCLNLKGRSHSVSPERFKNVELKHHGSSSSLPDLIKGKKLEQSCNTIEVNGIKENELKNSKNKSEKSDLKVNTENIVKILEIIRKSEDISNDLVFDVFDQILSLFDFKNLAHENIDSVQALPFDLYFSENDVKLISELFHSSLKTKGMFEWLSKFTGEWLEKAITSYPDFLKENLSVDSLAIDYKLSKTLRLFSHLLNEKEIIEIIQETGIECYYSSLFEVLDVYHDSSLSSVSNSTLNLANTNTTPKILNIVFFLINVGQIEQCSKYSHKINLMDMFFLILRFESNSKKSGKASELAELQCHTLFLSYLDKTSQSSQLINNCTNLIENYIVNCLENINFSGSCIRESNCNCGFPCSGFHSSPTMFSDIGFALIEKNWPENSAKCMSICNRMPYLWKYLIFFRRNEPLDNLLAMILQSGELQELENRSHEMSVNLFKISIEQLVKLKNGFCLNCNNKIKWDKETVSWSDFGMLSVKILGPKETLGLFVNHSNDIDPKELDQSFFQGLIFSSIMEKHSKGLRKNVVDLLKGRGMQESDLVPVLSQKVKTEVLSKSFLEKSISQGKESFIHHWGVKVNFKFKCGVCSLPLDTKVLISEAGLIVFKCSHAFHSACLRKVNLECPICKNKDTESEK